MRSRYWAFLEACDDTQSTRSVKDLLVSTFRKVGVDRFVILTHARPEDLRSLGVLVHNWPPPAIELLLANEPGEAPNPLFATLERDGSPLHWPPRNGRRDAVKRNQRLWFDQLRDLVGQKEGVSQALKSVIVNASCSLNGPEKLDADRVRLCMRIANAAYQQILALQKPRLSEAEQLTSREHQFLYRAIILGERPSDVANQLNVKISTVRTLRQKATLRLDAGSQEQSAWRMIETGQLFRSGRKTRPRGR
ncbi:MAG: hypothetical protein EON93_14490 [Burkholderiales bacterium]|nr:MAG: hypothetical protein EON93_14490 [Burkholderiales bacterium]